jgi:hypothetical protein
VLREAVPEVATQERAQPVDVLFEKGSIEPQVTSNLVDDFRADVGVEVRGGWVARCQVQDDEDECDDAD